MKSRPVIVDLGWGETGLALSAASSQLEIAAICAYDSGCMARASALIRDLAIAVPMASGGGSILGAPPSGNGSSAAHRLIRERARELGGVDYLALGPLSNLARAILADPGIVGSIGRIHLAGGAHAGGDASPAAERSIYADPEAAKVVFESGISVAMIGLDVERESRLSLAEARALAGSDALLPPGTERDGFVRGLELAAALSILGDGFISFRECHVDIETRGEITRGKTVCDVDNPRRGSRNARVALGLDHGGFVAEARRALSAPRSAGQ